ncbi:MAG: response regulator [Caldilineae bacterium]|nr:MAG: response regulator [Caldilineae bacterium]
MNNQTQPRRILVVDDEPSVAIMVSDGLEMLGDEYEIDIAHNAYEALKKLQEFPYVLVVTDYNMPEMSGLELFQAMQHVAPETRVVLMTAYGTEKLQEQIRQLGLAGYIDKPFRIEEIREVARRAVRHTTQQQADSPSPAAPQMAEEVNRCLKELQVQTGARCILLVTSNGFAMDMTGQTRHLDVISISALVAANFLAARELANLLGSRASAFKSSYYEGDEYNIYSYEINRQFLLAVLFGAECKPGIVWFYTKQTVSELERLLAEQSQPLTFSDEEVESILDWDFDGFSPD